MFLNIGIIIGCIMMINHYYLLILTSLFFIDITLFIVASITWFFFVTMKEKTILNFQYLFADDALETWFPSIIKINTPGAIDKTMVAVHPQGVVQTSAMILLTNMDLKILLNNILSKITGGWCSVDEEKIRNVMRSGDSLLLFPGGITEIAVYKKNEHHVFFKDDFIKYALHYGYSVIPAYNFSESAMYDKYNNLGDDEVNFSLEKNFWLNILAYVWSFPTGWFFTVPNKVPLMIVYGDTILFPQIINPGKEDIDTWREVYVEALTGVFNDNIDKWVSVYPNSTKELIFH